MTNRTNGSGRNQHAIKHQVDFGECFCVSFVRFFRNDVCPRLFFLSLRNSGVTGLLWFDARIRRALSVLSAATCSCSAATCISSSATRADGEDSIVVESCMFFLFFIAQEK